MALLRRALGDTLRGQRLRQRRTLREVSKSARVSLGYLSEIERGQKEASSELLAAICDALQTPLSEVLRQVSDTLHEAEAPATTAAPGAGVPVRHIPEPANQTALVDQFGSEHAELDPTDDLLVRLELDSMRLDPEVAARLCAEATDGKVTVAA